MLVKGLFKGCTLKTSAVMTALVFIFFSAKPAIASVSDFTEVCSTGFTQLAKTIDEISYPRHLREKHFHVYDPSAVYESPRDYDRAWRLTARYDIERNAKHIRASIEQKDPQIRFLEDLGFKFDFEKGHTIPSMSAMASAYDARLEELIKSGKVQRSQTLRPARLFAMKTNGKVHYIPVGVNETPPIGSLPVNGGIHGEEFYKFIEKGYWPVGELVRGTPSNTSFAFHDLGHFGAFSRDPDFMAAIREFARSRVAEGRFEISEAAVNHIFENLTVARTDLRPAFDHHLQGLGLSGSAERAPWNLSRYTRELSELSKEKIDEAVNQAYENRHIWIQDLGGIRNDAVSKHRVREPNYGSKDRATSENPKTFLEQAYEASTLDERRKHFARYLTAVDHTIRIPSVEWVREITPRDRIRQDSAIYQYICSSRVFVSGSALYNEFCRER